MWIAVIGERAFPLTRGLFPTARLAWVVLVFAIFTNDAAPTSRRKKMNSKDDVHLKGCSVREGRKARVCMSSCR